MEDFEKIWSEFSYILDDFRDGVCFFEGYILSIDGCKLSKAMGRMSRSEYKPDFTFSIWSDESTAEDWNKTYSVDDYVSFYKSGRISNLHLNYEVERNGIDLNIKLIFEAFDQKPIHLNLICYREAILNHHKPKNAVKEAIQEFKRVFEVFGGETLFISTDNLEYPEGEDNYPEHWIKIATKLNTPMP